MESPVFANGNVTLHQGDALDLYDRWDAPVVIVSDGAYGLGGKGDVPSVAELPLWYEPHVRAWAGKATPLTTLWFWNTEIGWATVHPLLVRHGWVYRQCCIWDKGLTHAVNTSNTKTLRKLPTVSEVCAQYVRPPEVRSNGAVHSVQQWLRSEWRRAGLTMKQANESCGMRNQISRRYLASDHHWYCPTPDVFARLAAYANKYGDPTGRPYFSLDGKRPGSGTQWRRVGRDEGGQWSRSRAKFFCPLGLTNVWREKPVRGRDRITVRGRTLHPHQKPIALMERILQLSSEPGDMVWEPFGGLCTAALAASRLGRRCVAAEIRPEVFRAAVRRFELAERSFYPEFQARRASLRQLE